IEHGPNPAAEQLNLLAQPGPFHLVKAGLAFDREDVGCTGPKPNHSHELHLSGTPRRKGISKNLHQTGPEFSMNHGGRVRNVFFGHHVHTGESRGWRRPSPGRAPWGTLAGDSAR